MVAQIVEFLIQFLEGHVAGIARDADVDGVDPVAEACAQIDRCVLASRPCSVERVRTTPLRRRAGVASMAWRP